MATTDWATAAEIAEAVSRGRTSALQVIEAALARIAAHDPALNAFTDVMAERARAQGRCDRRGARARASRSGPLAGVPFAVKNLFDMAGLPTRRRLEDQPRPAAGAARCDADRAAGGGRRRAGRRAQHGRIRLRLHRREHARRRRRAIRTTSAA